MDSPNLEYNVIAGCEHPKSVRNRYTGQEVIVPCGTCNTCRIRKGGTNSILCSYEEAEHRFTYFVTLTFSNDYLPLLTPVYHNDEILLYDARTKEFVLNVPRSYFKSINKAIKQADLHHLGLGDVFPYNPKEILQLFIKRFRKHVRKISPSPIRYYAVSEYGPVHLRSHWHIIFYLDDRKQAENFAQCLYKSWRYGFINYSLSRGKCNTYLAQYVNSFSCLPRIYALKLLRPRCFHSFSFGMAYFRRNKKEIYENGLEYFTKTVVTVGGRNTFVSCLPTAKMQLFPLCIGFGSASHRERHYLYTVSYTYAIQFGSERKPHKVITDYLYGRSDPQDKCTIFRELVDTLLRFSPSPARCLTDYDYCYSYFYRLFYISRHFINFCCDGDVSKAEIVLCTIEKFYNDLQLRNLRNWYSAMEEYSATYGTPLDVFYPCTDLFSDYDGFGANNPVYHRIRFSNAIKFGNSIKHKKLNDINNLLNNN